MPQEPVSSHVGPVAWVPWSIVISCKYFLVLTLWRCFYTLASPYLAGQVRCVLSPGNLHLEFQKGFRLEKAPWDSRTKSNKGDSCEAQAQECTDSREGCGVPQATWAQIQVRGLQVHRQGGLLRGCWPGARWLLRHFWKGRPAFFLPDVPVLSYETVCRHCHLNPTDAYYADSHLLCCINMLEVPNWLSHEERMSFALFLHFRGCGLSVEIADSWFWGWVNKGRWLTFPLSEWKDARGLARTKISVWIGS